MTVPSGDTVDAVDDTAILTVGWVKGTQPVLHFHFAHGTFAAPSWVANDTAIFGACVASAMGAVPVGRVPTELWKEEVWNVWSKDGAGRRALAVHVPLGARSKGWVTWAGF